MIAHPLTTLLYETFGQQFSNLLLAGYGEEPSGKRKRLHLIESRAEGETDWVIEMVGEPPYRDEPLVLAALLKLLLSRSNISYYLEFDPNEVLTELRWQDTSYMRQKMEAAINRYVRLLYDKRISPKVGQCLPGHSEGGCYHLLTGYIRGAKLRCDETLERTLSGVYFNAGLIEGLKRGRVYFAGIDFGRLKG